MIKSVQLLIAILMIAIYANGNQKITFIHEYANKNLYIVSYEEDDTNQNSIVEELAQRLIEAEKYTGKVAIIFYNDAYPDYLNCPDYPNYSLCYFDKKADTIPAIVHPYNPSFDKGIMLTIAHKTIKPREILNILDYAMKYPDSIRANSVFTNKDKENIEQRRKSIPDVQIEQVSKNSLDNVNELIASKTYVKEHKPEWRYHYSYFFQDDSFHFFYKNQFPHQDAFISTASINELKILQFKFEQCPVIFTTDSTFILVNDGKISTLQTIHNLKDYYRSMRKVSVINGDLIAISYLLKNSGNGTRYKTALYYIHNSKLVENIDALFSSKTQSDKDKANPLLHYQIAIGVLISLLLIAMVFIIRFRIRKQ